MLFVALCLGWVGLSAILAAPQLSKASDAEIATFFADQSNRLRIIGGFLVLSLAGIALLVFVAAQNELIKVRTGDGGAHVASTTALVSGAVVAGLLFVFDAANALIPWAFEESDHFRLDPNSARLVEGLTNLLAIEGALVGAVFLGTSARLLRRLEVVPGWLGRSGVVAAVIVFLLAAPFHGVALGLLLPWVLAVSVALLASARPCR